MSFHKWRDLFREIKCKGLFLQQITAQTQALEHHLNIQNPLKRSLISTLNSDGFWEKICSQNQDVEAFEGVKTFWRKHQKYAHLSSQKLLFLKYQYLHRLERLLKLQINDWENEKDLAKDFYFLVPNTKRINSLSNAISNLKEISYQLDSLKKEFRDAAFERALFYKQECNSRYIDDVIYITLEKVKKISQAPLPFAEQPPVIGLDDDSRIMIFDWMTEINIHESDLRAHIIEPINQKPFRPPLENELVVSERSKAYSLLDSIERSLQIRPKHKLIECQKEKLRNEEFAFFENVFLLIKKRIGVDSIKGFLRVLNDWRSIAIPLISISLYFMLAPGISAFLNLYIGIWATSWIMSFGFYGIALFPTWYFGIKSVMGLFKRCTQLLKQKKNHEVLSAIEIIITNNQFLKDYLSAGIVDIPHFNSEQLEVGVQTRVKELDTIKHSLCKVNFWDKFLLRGAYRRAYQDVLMMLEKQKNVFKERLKLYARFIANRMSHEVQLLKKKIDEPDWEPRISSGHFKMLRGFVLKHGEKKDLVRFDQCNDLSHSFSQYIMQFNAIYKSQYYQHSEVPWGGFEIHFPALNGWRKLIGFLMANEEKKQALLQVLKILNNKSSTTLDALQAAIKTLQVEDPNKLLKFIQMSIFLTLDKRDPRAVALLDDQHKRQIQIWYSKNKTEISKAYKFMSKVFSCPPSQVILIQEDEEKLAKYFHLLDSLAYVKMCSPKLKNNKIQNLAQSYFYKYQGEHDKAVIYIRFLPKQQQKKQVVLVAGKRINYLLSNQNKYSYVSDFDIELFKNIYLIQSDFNLDEIVCTHDTFIKAFSIKYRKILVDCVDAGIVNKKILRQYDMLHKTPGDISQNMASLPFFHTKSGCAIQSRKNNPTSILPKSREVPYASC